MICHSCFSTFEQPLDLGNGDCCPYCMSQHISDNDENENEYEEDEEDY